MLDACHFITFFLVTFVSDTWNQPCCNNTSNFKLTSFLEFSVVSSPARKNYWRWGIKNFFVAICLQPKIAQIRTAFRDRMLSSSVSAVRLSAWMLNAVSANFCITFFQLSSKIGWILSAAILITHQMVWFKKLFRSVLVIYYPQAVENIYEKY